MPSDIETDLNRWTAHASNPIRRGFGARAELAALFIRPGDAVCDLGAGAQPLKAFLPSNVDYLPVDCVGVIPGTHLADFNQPDFTLPAERFNVIAALGLFAWIKDLDGFLTRLSDECEGKFIIFSYDFWKLEGQARNDGLHNQIDGLDEGVALFSKYIRDLTAVAVMRRRVLFTGVLGRAAPVPLERRSASEIILQQLRPADYLTVKWLRRKIAPRWLS